MRGNILMNKNNNHSGEYRRFKNKYIRLRKSIESIKKDIAENGNSDINTQTVLYIIDKYTKEGIE